MKTQYDGAQIDSGQRLSAGYINRIADILLQRISVVGGKFWRNGNSLCLDVRSQGQGSTGGYFIGKIVTTGPNSAADFTDARYWVQEQSASFGATGTITLSTMANGRLVCATNIQELGIGSSDAGTHGLLFKSGETPSRGSSLTAPSRYVLVHGVSGGYVFSTPPFVYLEDSYYYDVYGVDGDGCPDSAKWWKGVLPFCVVDYDASPP
jgi:hypothetical protein